MERTVFDWLDRARGCVDASEVDRCLDEAAALARRGYEWCTILAALGDLPGVAPRKVAALADQTLECAVGSGEVWGFCQVATVRADMLDDEVGARRALQAGVDTFRRRDTTAMEWAQLADGFAETLDDLPGARRCLAEGRDAALRERDADDLANIAATLNKLGDRPAAVAVAAEAEALLGDDFHAVWSVANVWHEIEPAASIRLLTAATERVYAAGDACVLALACHSHEDGAGTDRALARGRELAVTAEDWYEIASTSRDTGRGASAVRAALDRAAAAVADDVTRQRIAAAYHGWLSDAETAARIGPRGVRPESLRVARRSLPGWHSTPAPLFDWLRARISPETLDRIAEANYGADIEDNHAALLDIVSTGLVPHRLLWHPREVIALTRWSNGENVDHVERAWCCTLLCLDGDDLENVAPGLIESCLALGGTVPEFAEQLLAWVCETDETVPAPGGGAAWPTLALYALLLLRAAQAPADPRVARLVSMILDSDPGQPGSLFRWSQLTDLWNELGERILVPLRPTRPDVDRVLHAVGWPVAEDWDED
jgi:hypothetical protein